MRILIKSTTLLAELNENNKKKSYDKKSTQNNRTEVYQVAF